MFFFLQNTLLNTISNELTLEKLNGPTTRTSTWIISFHPYAAGGWFGQRKMMQKNWKMYETLAHRYSFESTQFELSNEYQLDRV